MSKHATTAAAEAVPSPTRRRKRAGHLFTLRLLRDAVGLTQTELAEKAHLTQSEVSKIEHRSDALVSSLARYVEGLGGELELHARVGDHAYRIVLVDRDE